MDNGELDQCVRKTVDAMPLLTGEQRERLGILMAGKRRKVRKS